MKEEKGITLISLIAYIIILLVVISIVTLATNSFVNNMDGVEEDTRGMAEVNKFDVAFLKDLKQEGVSVYQISEDNNKLVLEYQDGKDIQYIWDHDTIYRIDNGKENVKICQNIEKFKVEEGEEKLIITIQVKGQKENQKEYKLGKY